MPPAPTPTPFSPTLRGQTPIGETGQEREDHMSFRSHPEEVNREANMKARGIARYTDREEALRSTAYHQTDEGRELITGYIPAIAARLKALVEGVEAQGRGRRNAAVTAIAGLPFELTAYLALQAAFGAAVATKAKHRAIGRAVTRIGEAVYDELNLRAAAEAKPEVTKVVRRFGGRRAGDFVREKAYAAAELTQPTVREASLLGLVLLEVILEEGLLVKQEEQHGDTLEVSLSFSSSLIERLERRRELAGQGKLVGITPVYSPMLEVPRDWTSPTNGGYRRLRLPLVKGGKADYESADMSRVYAAVNAMQRVPLQINERILDLVERLWSEGVEAGKLPTAKTVPLPDRLTPEAWAALPADLRRLRGQQYRDAKETNSKALSALGGVGQVLDMARELMGQTFYLPYQLDFRGRVYAVPLLSHQGPDWQRAMLDFAESRPCGDRGGMWLAIALAGHWDGPQKLSKASFQARADWSFASEEWLRQIAADPYAHREWLDADKPWLFLRTAMDFVGYLDEGESFIARVPVSLDGSCSGIQHYSAMLRDPVGGASVNLIPAEVPADVYGEVATEVQALLAEAADCPERAFWIAHGVTRKIVKKPVMTYGYSSREAGFAEWYENEFVRPALRLRGEIEGTTSNKLARYLARLTLRAVERKLVAVAGGMEWLMACAKAAGKADRGIEWVTPAGLPVKQEIRVTPSVVVETTLGQDRLRVRIPGAPREIDATRMANGIGPNFVHSLDAAHLMLCVNRMVEDGLSSFLLIHDSFGALPADVDTLYAAVRETFVDMYAERDPMADLVQRLTETLPEDAVANIPAPPEKGTLDLEAITASAYCFA